MVNLQKIDDSSVKFVFTDSDHYLVGNGEIVVPINSLSLVIDESEMVTFKKSATGDPFLSFRADNSNLGTKEAIEQFYKENMVGAGGISEEEVQDMIDSATSGMATDTQVQTLEANKFDGATYDSVNHLIKFTANGVQKATIDASAFIKDGMVSTVAIDGDYLVITFNTDAGKDPIRIPLSSIFDPSVLDDYYTKTQIDGFLDNTTTMLTTISGDVQTNAANIQDINDTIDEKEEVIASALTEVRQDVADIDAKEEVIASALTEVRQNVDTLSGDVQTKVATSDFNAYSAATATALNAKADLSAVTAVSNDLNTLSGNVLDNEYTVSQSLNDLNSRKLDASAYTPTDLSQYWTSAQTQSAIDDVKAYYVDFGVLTTQGIHDADWDGLVNAINAHRPIYAELGSEYYTAECLTQSGNQIIMTASNHLAHFFYTFTKNGSENYSFSYETRPYTTQAEKDSWNAKQDALTAGSGIEISGNVISAIGGGVTVDSTLDSGSTNPVANSAITTALNEKQDILSDVVYSLSQFDNYIDGHNVLHTMFKNHNYDYDLSSSFVFGNINGESVLCPRVNSSSSWRGELNLVETSAITTSMTSSSTDAQVPSAKAVYDTLGGLKLVKIFKADYDALATKDENTLYIIPDGDGGSSDWEQ